MQLLILACMAAVATAHPSYIAVPVDQIAFLDLSRSHVRVPRQTLVPPPPPQPQPRRALFNNDDYSSALLNYAQPIVSVSPSAETQPPTRVVTLQQHPQEVTSAASAPGSTRLSERPPDFGEYVDFGAHTGDNGAFGWYADYPINNRDDSY